MTFALYYIEVDIYNANSMKQQSTEEMSLHLDILSYSRAIQYLLILFHVGCLEVKLHMPIS